MMYVPRSLNKGGAKVHGAIGKSPFSVPRVFNANARRTHPEMGSVVGSHGQRAVLRAWCPPGFPASLQRDGGQAVPRVLGPRPRGNPARVPRSIARRFQSAAMGVRARARLAIRSNALFGQKAAGRSLGFVVSGIDQLKRSLEEER